MTLHTQLSNQLDRIWSIILKTDNFLKLANSVTFRDSYKKNMNYLDLEVYEKREILALCFMAKDEAGEYVLKLPEPKVAFETRAFIGITNYDKVGDTYVYIDPDKIPTTVWQDRPYMIALPMRDLFLQNCFGQTESEIENLKLIKF